MKHAKATIQFLLLNIMANHEDVLMFVNRIYVGEFKKLFKIAMPL